MRETLERGLPELGIDPAVIPALEQFAEMMLERNKVMNLTAITEPRDVAALHLLDSLALLPLAGLENERLVDVGCGAGFPGVPLAIAGRRLEVTLLDSQRKRVDFLEEARAALGLENAAQSTPGRRSSPGSGGSSLTPPSAGRWRLCRYCASCACRW